MKLWWIAGAVLGASFVASTQMKQEGQCADCASGGQHAAAQASAKEDGCACKEAVAFRLQATDGKTWTQETILSKPTLVVFLKAKCPHTPPALADFNRLAKDFGGKATVVGMIDLKIAEAKEFAKKNKVAFPLIADPGAETMVKMGAAHSLDMALSCPKDKRIGSTYEGYSREILGKVLKDMVQHGGPSLKVDLSKYPAKKASGCGL
ncbi:MAG: redoxin domain-containing protein [Fimbriimonadales bacterium]